MDAKDIIIIGLASYTFYLLSTQTAVAPNGSARLPNKPALYPEQHIPGGYLAGTPYCRTVYRSPGSLRRRGTSQFMQIISMNV